MATTKPNGLMGVIRSAAGEVGQQSQAEATARDPHHQRGDRAAGITPWHDELGDDSGQRAETDPDGEDVAQSLAACMKIGVWHGDGP